VPRSGREARQRLEQAALDLYVERGFDAVTIAEIAERAGVTERTYFRHFPDKREVVFGGEQQLVDWVEDALGALTETLGPLATLRFVVARIVPSLEANREASGRLAVIIAATPSLQERATAKEAHLTAMITDALVARGVDRELAGITTRAAWGVLTEAVTAWRATPATPLQTHVDRGFTLLRDALAV
jgi:AcrR family transcriptional regulator